MRLRALYESAQSFDLAAQLLDFVAQMFDLARLRRVLLWASLRQKRLSRKQKKKYERGEVLGECSGDSGSL